MMAIDDINGKLVNQSIKVIDQHFTISIPHKQHIVGNERELTHLKWSCQNP